MKTNSKNFSPTFLLGTIYAVLAGYHSNEDRNAKEDIMLVLTPRRDQSILIGNQTMAYPSRKPGRTPWLLEQREARRQPPCQKYDRL